MAGVLFFVPEVNNTVYLSLFLSSVLLSVIHTRTEITVRIFYREEDRSWELSSMLFFKK